MTTPPYGRRSALHFGQKFWMLESGEAKISINLPPFSKRDFACSFSEGDFEDYMNMGHTADKKENIQQGLKH